MKFDVKIRAHESFYIRRGWLQKGVKNIKMNDRIFNDKDINACDVLGIGTNMVKSLKYWLVATGICSEETVSGKKKMKITKLGHIIDEYDRYYEEIGTNILIHYELVKNINNATAWYWLFNIYDGTVIDKSLFISEFNSFLKLNGKPESKVLKDEYDCILKTYIAADKEDDPEETKVCPLADLGLLTISDTKFLNDSSEKEVRKTSIDINNVHPLIALAMISDFSKRKDEVSINDLCEKENSIGRVLNLSRISLFAILDELSKRGYITIERTAGLDVIKFVNKCSYLEAVEMYYKELSGEEI